MRLNLSIFNLVLFLGVSAKPKQRIIGGQDAQAGEFPFAAAIHIQTSEGSFFCGGTLIRRQWILTSANCVNNGKLFTIQLGSTTLTQSDSNRITVESDEYYIHPDFNPETIEADVGLIKLRMEMELSDYIKSAFLFPGNVFENATFTVIGWGQTSDSDAGLSEHLQHVEVVSLKNEECKLIYGDQISDNMICCEGNYNEGTCIGDTGGPIMIRTGPPENYNFIIGVSSFISGDGCESTHPSGFTRIVSYIAWLDSVMAGGNDTRS